ncbi:MAG: ABC transporter substrate-binding protein [Candidatus Coproplasma sp.]
MKKIFKGLVCAGVCASFAMTGLIGGCGIESAHRDSETSPLNLAIGAVDGNFNPLFYTSANDGTIASLTQVSLMTADANGDLAYGENYPTVALDYKETYYSDVAGTNVIGTGDGKTITGSSSSSGSTSYEFVIKNGIKFSDGVDLTVMDVLFNLYVYLDPLYSGSSTIYSTKIQGLQAYRQQDPNAEESASEDLTAYYARANQRILNLINWSNDEYVGTPTDEMKKDLETVKRLYKQELETDWNNLSTTWEDTYKDYRFTSAWQAFYFAEALVNKQYYINSTYNRAERFYDVNGNGERDEGEKYLTEFDPVFGESEPLTINPDDAGDREMSSLAADLTNEINEAVTEQKINEFLSANRGYEREDAILELQGEYAVSYVLENRAGIGDSMGTGVEYILQYCATAANVFDEFVMDERSKDVPTGELTVKTISGITVSRSSTFNGKDLGEEHDILKIMINGVDPKAKWNFSLAITPMHYYSDDAHTAAAMADYNDGKLYNNTASHFGVEYKNADFMNNVLAASSKTNLPVGAGPYKACSYKMNGEQVTGGSFHYNKKAYYERNEYFTTLGSGIENAKIKYVTYREMSDDKIVSALKAGEIDYGTPIAKAANQKEVNYGNLKQTTYQTGGYGYVGINPKSEKLRSVYVRQAIMYAFDTSSITEYYGQELVSLINRPMSVTSWASPENPVNISDSYPQPTRYYEMTPEVLGDKSEEEFIRELVGKSGTYSYDEDSGKIVDNSNGVQLELTFTIAGESTDHPSYNMFIAAKQFLERCGFKINVEHSALALQKLTTGDLEVWAAAWSSAIDPDPYQIYSMYSNASSTKNWYKQGIEMDGGSDTYNLGYEYKIAMQLTEMIEQGREQLNQADRIITYSRSLTNKKLYQTVEGSTEFYDVLSKLCCLDLIMELAVEFPTYQRNELCVYNASVLDDSTMRIKGASFNMGPIDELWKVGYRK